MAGSTSVVLILVTLLIPSAGAQLPSADVGLERCLVSAGLSSLSDLNENPWEARVTLTVSQDRDASKVDFDGRGATHAKFLVFSALPLLKFDKRCMGERISFTVRWEPTADERYGIAVRKNLLVVTGRSFTPQAHRYGGPLQLDPEDLEKLKRIDSLRKFLAERKYDPGY